VILALAEAHAGAIMHAGFAPIGNFEGGDAEQRMIAVFREMENAI
jgi:hypothetical protein